MNAFQFESAETLEDVLERQSGVVRPADADPWLSLDDLRQEVSGGRWCKPHRGIYVAHNGDLTTEQERWVCLLCSPAGSALAGLTAAELDGLKGFSVAANHVLLPPGYRKRRRAGLVTHYATLTAADVHPLREPRRTRLPRSLIDGAVWTRHDRHARAIVLAGVQQRLVRPDDLRAALASRGADARNDLILESISDAEGGVASVPEKDFQEIERRHHLPPPDRQVVVRRTDGRYYLDVHWREYQLSTEIHGTQHLAIPTWDADLDRHTELTANGRAILQFSSYSVRHRQTHVASLVITALRNRGWPGPC